ncbi:hypothetical protein GCM10020001_084800 [Nonomuraea salmonea]
MGVGEEAHGQLVEVARLYGVVADHRQPVEVVGRERPAEPGQPVPGGHDGAQRLAEDDPGVERGDVERRPGETEVELAAQQAVHLPRGHPFVQDDVDVGELLGQAAQQRAEHADGRDGGEPEPHGARRAAGDPARPVARGVDQREHAPGVLQEAAPGVGEHDAAVVTLQQGHADGAFELLDVPAERRLRHAQAVGRAAEVQLFGDRDEGPDLVEGQHDARRVSLDTEKEVGQASSQVLSLRRTKNSGNLAVT